LKEERKEGREGGMKEGREKGREGGREEGGREKRGKEGRKGGRDSNSKNFLKHSMYLMCVGLYEKCKGNLRDMVPAHKRLLMK
jgi:flagellar biosynthesis/type III secretory pathway protein FliH